MPISKNTSSNGAPKRSASRLERIPAITRTAPRRIAMLTASREAMNYGLVLASDEMRCAPSPACGGGPGWGCLRESESSSGESPHPPQAGEVDCVRGKTDPIGNFTLQEEL